MATKRTRQKRAQKELSPDIRERTRAAVCLVNAAQDPALEMNAFLALFHPKLPKEKRIALTLEARERRR